MNAKCTHRSKRKSQEKQVNYAAAFNAFGIMDTYEL